MPSKLMFLPSRTEIAAALPTSALRAMAFVALLAPSAASAANSFFAPGDLVLFFQQEGGTNTVYASLGNTATAFRGAAAGPSSAQQSLNITNIGATLTTAFGAGWASDTTLYAGLAGVWGTNGTNSTLTNGDPHRTLYVSQGRDGLGDFSAARSSAFGIISNTNMTGGASSINARINLVFDDASGTNSYDAVSVVSPTSVSGIDDANPFLAPGIQDTAFTIFSGGVQQRGASGNFGTITSQAGLGTIEFSLDLYRLLARATGGSGVGQTFVSGQVDGPLREGSYEGSVVIGTDGNVSFLSSDPGTAAAPEISVSVNSTELTDAVGTLDLGSVETGSSGTPLTVTVTNTGDAALTGLAVTKSGNQPDEFIIDPPLPAALDPLESTSFTITFSPSATGARSATLSIASNDADENPFDINVSGTGTVPPGIPDIAVSAPDSLTSGSSSVSFGTVNTGSSGSPLTFAITNTGTGDLTGIVVSKTGTNSGDFAITQPAVATLAPAATTTFTVAFSPSGDGARAAAVQIASNDPDENPFIVSLTGTGFTPPPATPEILVERGATALSDGGTLALEDTVTGTDGNPETITIRNTGTADLTGLSVTVEGTNPGDFPVTQPLVATLAPAESTTFTLGFSPNADGLRTAVVKISSNDSDENPFDINLSGTGFTPAPEITVLTSAGSPLVSAAATSSQLFGNITVGSTSAAKILTIRNDGDAPLGPLSVAMVGSNAADFPIGSLSSTTLAPGASTTVSVSFKPLAAGSRIATLQIGSNDADENPFAIALSGTGVVPVPDIDVQQPAKSSLVDGKSTKNFGTVKLKKTRVLIFTIRNTGSGTLSGLAVSSSGKNAKQFAVSKPKAASLTPGASTTFAVTFKPVKAGANSALIKVASNDPNENPFDIPVKGVGAK